jgi:hypothetical protein
VEPDGTLTVTIRVADYGGIGQLTEEFPELVVTIRVADYGGIGQLTEEFPDDFTFESSPTSPSSRRPRGRGPARP